MPLGERQTRWRKLMDSVETDDVHKWLSSFLDELDQVATIQEPGPTLTLVS